jgi:Domain of unknown function (DUF222)
MFPQVNAILQPLAGAIDRLDLPVDNDLLAEAFALADRLNAKLIAAVGEHDVAEMWRNDGAISMTAWLRHRAHNTSRDAALCAKTARRLRQLPVTAAAYREGRLSGGQVQAIVANLSDRTAGLFAEHEAELFPGFAELSVAETATTMQSWARHAEATLDDPPDKSEPERSLHVSPPRTWPCNAPGTTTCFIRRAGTQSCSPTPPWSSPTTTAAPSKADHRHEARR